MLSCLCHTLVNFVHSGLLPFIIQMYEWVSDYAQIRTIEQVYKELTWEALWTELDFRHQPILTICLFVAVRFSSSTPPVSAVWLSPTPTATSYPGHMTRLSWCGDCLQEPWNISWPDTRTTWHVWSWRQMERQLCLVGETCILYSICKWVIVLSLQWTLWNLHVFHDIPDTLFTSEWYFRSWSYLIRCFTRCFLWWIHGTVTLTGFNVILIVIERFAWVTSAVQYTHSKLLDFNTQLQQCLFVPWNSGTSQLRPLLGQNQNDLNSDVIVLAGPTSVTVIQIMNLVAVIVEWLYYRHNHRATCSCIMTDAMYWYDVMRVQFTPAARIRYHTVVESDRNPTDSDWFDKLCYCKDVPSVSVRSVRPPVFVQGLETAVYTCGTWRTVCPWRCSTCTWPCWASRWRRTLPTSSSSSSEVNTSLSCASTTVRQGRSSHRVRSRYKYSAVRRSFSLTRSLSQFLIQSFSHSVIHSVRQSVTHSLTHSLSHLLPQSLKQPTYKPTYQPINKLRTLCLSGCLTGWLADWLPGWHKMKSIPYRWEVIFELLRCRWADTANQSKAAHSDSSHGALHDV